MPKIKYQNINLGADRLSVIQKANEIIEEYQRQGLGADCRGAMTFRASVFFAFALAAQSQPTPPPTPPILFTSNTPSRVRVAALEVHFETNRVIFPPMTIDVAAQPIGRVYYMQPEQFPWTNELSEFFNVTSNAVAVVVFDGVTNRITNSTVIAQIKRETRQIITTQTNTTVTQTTSK